jgi:hypothetical protein
MTGVELGLKAPRQGAFILSALVALPTVVCPLLPSRCFVLTDRRQRNDTVGGEGPLADDVTTVRLNGHAGQSIDRRPPLVAREPSFTFRERRLPGHFLFSPSPRPLQPFRHHIGIETEGIIRLYFTTSSAQLQVLPI